MSDSRAALLAAGAEEFSRRGLDGTRVQAIVARSGVNERMIYHHFGSKEGLYRAVLETEVARLGERMSALADKITDIDDVYEATRLVLTTLTDQFLSRPAMAGLWFHEAAAQTPVLSQLNQGQGYPPRPLRALYERGRREGVFRSDVPVEIFHATAISAILGLATLAPLRAQAGMAGIDDAAFVDGFVGQLLDGMTGPRPD
jgi:AcrR family transcriptional regulator